MEHLYLELLKKCVLGELYWENEARILYLRDSLAGRDQYSPHTLLRIDEERGESCRQFLSRSRVGRVRDDDVDNLGFQHTMIGRLRLDNLAACLERIHRLNVPGDLIECGVWRGGATIFMRGFLKAYGITDRTVWVADSFAGLPPPGLPQDAGMDLSASQYPALAISLETVRDLFARYDLLDGQVRFLPGWFKDTLPDSPIQTLALLRLDGDLYESTWDALTALYPKLSTGGFVIVDDYHALPGCRQAVEDYREREGISTPLEPVDWTAVFWQKDSTTSRSLGAKPRNSA
ncbi:MAG: TylF/MycF family methyltransferase [Acidobacteriia bacterium]|nr:TylF/MycF family methyltransferase [Terriglobia bacterium]